jgi:predicted nucleic acid-binding Zn ribbon protein
MALPMQSIWIEQGAAMPMTTIEELEREIRRDRRNMVFTVVLVVAVIALVVLAWSAP